MPLGRGILVAIEGVDRAGKSTQIGQLTRYEICLQVFFNLLILTRNLGILGYPHRSIHFPYDQTILGRMLCDYSMQNRHDIPSENASFMFTSNRWEQQPQMKDDMMAGKTILVDRYSHSGAAYEMARVNLCSYF